MKATQQINKTNNNSLLKSDWLLMLMKVTLTYL